MAGRWSYQAMKRLVLVLAAIGIAGCGSATAPTINRAFDLPIHTETAVSGSPFLVRFDSVVEDSRCPAGAACIQAGRAEVLVHVLPAGPHIPEAWPVWARLVDRPDSNTALVTGWFIEFVDLLPHPRLGEPPAPDARRVRLIIRQAVD
jgi:hypothetical protein